MSDKIILTASSENYLKAIYSIVKENKAARVKEISKYLNIGPSSVSEALKSLAEKELIHYEPYGIITLTDYGEEIAKELNRRHVIICDFLENVLRVNADIVDENAGKIEYSISEDVLNKFVRFLEFMQTCSCKEPKWIQSFKYYSENGELKDKCQKCTAKGKENHNCCGMSS
jgi:DtxR family transcriptional regulator, Mn-dependent transcriptional regulator